MGQYFAFHHVSRTSRQAYDEAWGVPSSNILLSACIALLEPLLVYAERVQGLGVFCTLSD